VSGATWAPKRLGGFFTLAVVLHAPLRSIRSARLSLKPLPGGELSLELVGEDESEAMGAANAAQLERAVSLRFGKEVSLKAKGRQIRGSLPLTLQELEALADVALGAFGGK